MVSAIHESSRHRFRIVNCKSIRRHHRPMPSESVSRVSAKDCISGYLRNAIKQLGVVIGICVVTDAIEQNRAGKRRHAVTVIISIRIITGAINQWSQLNPAGNASEESATPSLSSSVSALLPVPSDRF